MIMIIVYIVNKFVIIIKIMIMMMVIIIGLWMDVGMDQQGFVRQTWSVLRRQCVELPDTRTLSDGGGKHTLPYFQCPYQQAAATRTTLGADCSFAEWDGVGWSWEMRTALLRLTCQMFVFKVPMASSLRHAEPPS
jgi:hypothetical protein